MAGQVSPGIVLRERDLTSQTIVNTQANSAALVGNFEKGPIGTITNIATEKEFVDTFGSPNVNNYEDWFVGSTFLTYGGQLQVVRIDNTDLKNAATGVTATSSDTTKLYVDNAAGFANGDYVKVDDEYFLVSAVDLSAETLTVTRAQYGSSAADHTVGDAVTKWSLAQDGGFAATTVGEDLTSSETIITLSQTTGLSAGDYIKIGTELIRVTSVESPEVVGVRGALGTTAAAHTSGDSVEKWTFAATTPATTLTAAYPLVTGSTAPTIKSFADFEANQSSYIWKFAARTAGTWANGIKVVTIDGSVGSYINENVYGTTKWETLVGAPSTANDIHVVVLDASDNILETFFYLSRVSTAVDEQGASIYYANVINRRSQYVYAGGTLPTAGNQSHSISGGADGYSSSVSNISTAFDLFADTEEVEVDFLLGGGSLALESDQVTKVQKAISIATSRKDCVACVSPHKGFISLSSSSAQRDDIISFFDTVGSSNSYTVFDGNYKYIYDRYNDTYRYIPCCGDVAGLCVETSTVLEDWYSPAGLNRGNLKSVVKLAYVPSKTDRDKLYQKRINPITSFAGQGVVLFGDKTALATPSAFDRINVRRLFLAVEKRISQLAKGVLFELNDDATRTSFTTALNSYLSEVQAKRGVTDYLVVCDSTNNTSDVIDRNEFVAEVYLKPARSINFITITLVATRTGVSFNEVIGRV
jgi:uncharacterized Zn finger protein